jgi:hypothetical protein
LKYRGGKKYWALAISPYGKDSDDLLKSVNIVVSLVLNDLFKMFNPIEEDRLDIFKYQVFQDLCHGFQPSEMIRPLSCAWTFRTVRGCKCSNIANQVSGESIQALHRSFMQHFVTIGIVSVNEQWSPSIFMAKSPLLVEKITWNIIDEIVLVVF